MKLKKEDKVQVITGKDKGKSGKILVVDRKKNKVLVEGVNIVTKHVKPSAQNQQGGIIEKEAFIDASNVMFLHKGKPVRLGYQVEETEKDGKTVKTKKRVARPSGELVD
ncbi:MAG: 50S ribosomal protein L24 [Lachnospirales bacterium]